MLRRVTGLLQFVSCILPDKWFIMNLQIKQTHRGKNNQEVVIMTFGEKLRVARKEAGLSQEQFAEKMFVSRSAIAKWETDKGMPDVNNLKAMSQLLNISIDYLLDEDEKISFNEIKEAINLDDYEKTGKCRDKKDAVCFAKNKDASAIYSLIRQKKMNKAEWLVDFIVQPGIVHVADQLRELVAFYLVEKETKQYLVKVTKEFITTIELTDKVDVKKFVVGNYQYKKGFQIV